MTGHTPERLVVDTAGTFRVHTRAYADAAVFDLEKTRIFERSWLYVAHESEIAKPGDFKTAYVGTQPVIVIRDDSGAIGVLVNRCLHRASVVCRELRGNAPSFECPYHGWLYARDGKLIGIPIREDPSGYDKSFDAPQGLKRVPRIETYRGFIFANFDEAAPSLIEYLGRGRTMIDRKLNESPVGEIVVRPDPHVIAYQGNWKFQSENIVDGYHFMRVHKGFAALQEKYGDRTGDFGVHKGGTQAQMRKVRARGCSWGCPQGHGVCENPFLDLDRLLDGPHGAYYRELLAQHGEQEMQWMYGGNFSCVFPNFGILHHQIRTWRPLGPALTEVTFYTYDLKGAPDAINEGWLHSQERFYGPAGYGMPDDVEVFALNQQGLAGTAVEWLILERGLATDTMTNSGDLRGYPSAETPQRAFWRRWQELMAPG